MSFARRLLSVDSGAPLPRAIGFDGTNDFLSRSSDFTGNTDGKTFTFSGWVYIGDGVSTDVILLALGSNRFKLEYI